MTKSEIGKFNPNVRSIIAYNAESKVIETVSPNGILNSSNHTSEIPGTSSIVLDSGTGRML
jgi:hypothetical protein